MDLMKMKKCELRDRLSEMGLAVGGRKADMVKRLRSGLPTSPAPSSCSSCDQMGKRINQLEEMLKSLMEKLESTGLTPKPKAPPQKPDTVFTPVSRKRNRRNRRSASSRSNVLLLSDSHGRHCSRLLAEELGPRFQCSGIVKPGAPLREVVREAPALASSADTLFIIGGTNDVSDGRRIEADHLLGVLKKLKTKKVFVSKLPRRYDDRRLDQLTWRANKDLEELSSRFPANVQLVDLFGKMERQHYTRHGLHLNASGKRILAQKLKQVCCI